MGKTYQTISLEHSSGSSLSRPGFSSKIGRAKHARTREIVTLEKRHRAERREEIQPHAFPFWWRLRPEENTGKYGNTQLL